MNHDQAHQGDGQGTLDPTTVGEEANEKDPKPWWNDDQRIVDCMHTYEKLQIKNNTGILQRDILNNQTSDTPLSRYIVEPESVQRYSPPIAVDFTTPGAQGALDCPFQPIRSMPHSQINARIDPLPTPPELKEHLIQDPIAAEFNVIDVSSPPPSVTASFKCPIRFLDQHSPEEVAKYVENHKHEIPRSHEVCVRRYQKSQQSIRQLDAKYGNLVSMIQGLGMKHQSLLPTEEETQAAALERESMEKVEKWAEHCSDTHEPETTSKVMRDDESDARTGHFERPLEEIRVGESPSRPWGIHVPYTEGLALSSGPDQNEKRVLTETDVFPPRKFVHSEPSETKPAQCPFGHGRGRPMPQSQASNGPHESSVVEPVTHHTEPTNQSNDAKNVPSTLHAPDQPRMMFTGPVFIGYSPEHASQILQSFR